MTRHKNQVLPYYSSKTNKNFVRKQRSLTDEEETQLGFFEDILSITDWDDPQERYIAKKKQEVECRKENYYEDW